MEGRAGPPERGRLPRADPAGRGEGLAAMQARAVAAVRDWNARLGRRTRSGVACSHGDVIKAIVADALGLHLDQFQRISSTRARSRSIRYTALRPFVLSGQRHRGRRSTGLRAPGAAQAAASGSRRPATRPWAAAAAGGIGLGSPVMPQVFAYDPPERFVAGTVGEPGQRTFFLQAREGVAADDGRPGEGPGRRARRAGRRAARRRAAAQRRRGAVPPWPRPSSADQAPLETPIDEEFRVGTLAPGVGRRRQPARHRGAGDRGRARGRGRRGRRTDDDDAEPLDRLLVRLTPGAARAFVRRSQALVAAGRPPCPFCQQPLDPQGHICPRQRLPPALTARTTPSPSRSSSRCSPTAPCRSRAGSSTPPTPRSTAGSPSTAIDGRLRLQAHRGGAAAVGLPGRHARPPRGRGLRGLPGGRLGRRAADGAPRRAVRARHGPAGGSRSTRRSTWSHLVRSRHDERLRRIAVSTPSSTTPTARAATCCPTADGGLWAIDHGVAFSEDDKLRTVLWGWAGEPDPRRGRSTGCGRSTRPSTTASSPWPTRCPTCCPRARSPRHPPPRARRCSRSGRHPEPGGDWPPVPWPPF